MLQEIYFYLCLDKTKSSLEPLLYSSIIMHTVYAHIIHCQLFLWGLFACLVWVLVGFFWLVFCLSIVLFFGCFCFVFFYLNTYYLWHFSRQKINSTCMLTLALIPYSLIWHKVLQSAKPSI